MLALRAVFTLLFFAATIHAQQSSSMTGFTPARTQQQAQTEAQMKSAISADSARAFHREFTREPHPAGSKRNNELADYIADTWHKQGLEGVKLLRYDVLNSFPKHVSVEMVSPASFKASLREDAYDIDPDTRNPNTDNAYLGLSISGEVTAPIVYAYSGNPEDYEVLKKNGIDVRGKIVLVRYSNPYSYRGFKALTAQQKGAAAILIYSDPAEDGFKKGKVFPEGPWGPESHIQRGAITYDFLVPGDPLTPGWASVPGARQVKPEEARSLPNIIAVPLSWRDAKPLLEKMGGPVAPEKWQGGLPLKYTLGGKATVHINVQMDNRVAPNYVVEARIRGSEFPDEWILLGNHRDAWVFGGVDPSSGTASMMELSRVLGAMLKQGWRPRRTLVFASWDGEEVGLTGSTEYGEQFADELKRKLIAYLNVDSSTSGSSFEPDAVASLAPLLIEVSKTVQDPSGASLYEAWRKSAAKPKINEQDRNPQPVEDSKLVNTRIGSGSDHTVFLNHLGRPTVGLTFNGPYGVYHSMYDNHYWISNIGDPGFKYHALLSQVWGVTALRLANADVLPFDFATYARNIRLFVDDLKKNAGSKENIDFVAIENALGLLEAEGTALNLEVSKALQSGQIDQVRAAALNQTIMQLESNWLNPDGIPGRPWFKHMLYAARYTYAHLELPGLTEAVESGDWKVAKEQASLLQNAIVRNTELLRTGRQDFLRKQ
jgi:N-acetylated-alpha-linked acidic dipeptidase